MRIAEDIQQDGMKATGELLKFMSDLIAKEKMTKVIETGTYLGTGSTMAIIEGLTRHGLPFEFYTIEVNPKHHRMAQRNVPRLSGVHLVNGLTVGKQDLPDKLDFKKMPKDVIVDHPDEFREERYKNEVSFNVPDHQLERILAHFNYKPDLVFLDSAGHMGWVEYEYLMNRVQGDFYLILDDTNHVKHYKSVREAKKKHDLIFSTDDKFGGACFKVSISNSGLRAESASE